MTEPVIAVEHLTKRFGDVLAVDGVSFTVARGLVCALLGGQWGRQDDHAVDVARAARSQQRRYQRAG